MKTFLKHPILTRLYQAVFLLIVTFLPQFILGLMLSYNRDHSHPFSSFQSWLIILIGLLTLYGTYRWAKGQGFLSGPFHLNGQELRIISLGFMAIYAINTLGTLLLSTLSGAQTTVNQAQIYQLFTLVPYLPMAFIIISAGFFEELLFRSWIFSCFTAPSWSIMVISATIFCLMHSPTNLASIFIYFGMGFVLSFVYYKTKNPYANMTLHLLWNTLGMLSTLLLLG